MRRLGVWIPFFAMLAAPAFGQSGTRLPNGGLAPPPDVYSPPSNGLAIPNDAVNAPSPSGPESIGLGEMLEPRPWELGDECLYEGRAPLESTGTWLQRGYTLACPKYMIWLPDRWAMGPPYKQKPHPGPHFRAGLPFAR